MTQLASSLLTYSIRLVVLLLLLSNGFFILSPRRTSSAPSIIIASSAFEGVVVKSSEEDSDSIVSSSQATTDAENDDIALLEPSKTSLCTRTQIQDGEWHPIRLDRPPYIPPNNPKLICGPMKIYQQDYFDSYEWRPHDASCDFMPWNKTHFCETLQNQTILFMGDSLTQEAMFALGELLGLRYSADDSNDNPLYNWSAACHGTVGISFRRDDLLDPAKVKWELDEKQPSVTVLNRGAHVVKDEWLLQDLNETLEYVRQWQALCGSQGRRCLLVWRSTVPGHPKCGRFTTPTTNRTYMERLVQIIPRSRGFGWDQIQRQNELVQNVLAASGVDYEMLDAYDVNILRPDSHRVSEDDCLHSCLGSKLDVYSQLLLHILRRKQLEQRHSLPVD